MPPSYRGLRILYILLFCLLLRSLAVRAQNSFHALRQHEKDSVTYRTFCKQYLVIKVMAPATAAIAPAVVISPKPWLTVHGNVRYDFLYRSYIDTPFSQRNFQQHTVQTTLNIAVRDKYPLRLSLTGRTSNSPFFRNFLDANLLFDRTTFNRNYKQQLLDRIITREWTNPDLSLAEEALSRQKERIAFLRQRLQQPDIGQRIVEEKERAYNKAIGIDDKLPADTLLTQKEKWGDRQRGQADSLSGKYEDLIADKKKELDSLQQELNRLQRRSDSIKRKIQQAIMTARKKINGASTSADLSGIAAEYGQGSPSRKSLDGILANMRTLGVGRSVANYSELTVMNVSLTGLQAEYNPQLYAAIAVGKIDYGFRDFMGRNRKQENQQLLMGRFGIGNKDRRAIIVSVFTGRKYNYGAAVADTVSNHINLLGYSVEGIWKKNEHTGITAEVAKSTGPATGRLRDNKEMERLVQFNDGSNLAVSIKANTRIVFSNTRISGFYRKSGERFQSFSLFTYNTDQLAWQLRAEQPLFNNRAGLTVMLRRNDFTNPFTERTYKSSTVFKSIQLNVRVPRYPVLSVGYFPGTQLYLVDREKIRENAYYILNGSLLHQYKVGGLSMLSSFIFNKYDARGTETGFVAYNGTNYMAAQSVFFSRLQLQGMYSYNDQQELQYYTAEAGLDYAARKRLKLGAGVKYNKVAAGDHYWGGRMQFLLEVGRLGGLQLQYERSFLPTIYQTLFTVETGKISWYKNF